MPDALDRLRSDPVAFRNVLHVRTSRGVVRLGPVLADFQRRDFEAFDALAIAIRDGLLPQPRKLWCERTKGASKSSDLAVVLLWLLLACPHPVLSQIAAGDGEQAREIWRAMRSILKLRENQWLARILKVRTTKIVNETTGSAAEFLTADALGQHGSRVDGLLIIDEVSHAQRWEFIETLLDNSAKLDCGGLICATNAGLLTSPAHAMREVARTSAEWHFSAFRDVAPWISAREVIERKRLTSLNRFRRLWQGDWTAEAEQGIDPRWIERACVLDGPT